MGRIFQPIRQTFCVVKVWWHCLPSPPPGSSSTEQCVWSAGCRLIEISMLISNSGLNLTTHLRPVNSDLEKTHQHWPCSHFPLSGNQYRTIIPHRNQITVTCASLLGIGMERELWEQQITKDGKPKNLDLNVKRCRKRIFSVLSLWTNKSLSSSHISQVSHQMFLQNFFYSLQ